MALHCVQTTRFSDFEEFAGALPGAAVTATPLRAGTFGATTTNLRLEDVVLHTGRSTPLMTLGDLASG
ncbi:MAG: hypothetical protein IRZ13_03210 [Acetobacteraceae bacterium]|nr:hypothetical protein [Acetobacteraceae bacterium]